ncbi:universal stress protein [Mesobacillus foraminis]|uniref:Universal stress protein n=1 Tax=Mesobacillus foraminis TaxID=279826 RepID=A0A4R2BCH4_9BACI|nr:universal stress protein [Mesobacillus foraminis]TCN24436.1 nucleotide-binding universal stress UspA family protein [Mesobacillus foraminis]
MGLTYQNILVAVDGSKEAAWAFKKAIEIAKRNSAKMILTHVIDLRTFATVEAYDRTVTERAGEFATELLENYRQQALEAGVAEVAHVLDYGSPKVKIAKEIAKKHNADLIICGATGMNAVERFFIGSVSEHIVRYASCDVMIIRTPKETTGNNDQ